MALLSHAPHTHIHTFTHKQTHLYTHTHSHIYTHTLMHTHTYTQTHGHSLSLASPVPEAHDCPQLSSGPKVTPASVSVCRTTGVRGRTPKEQLFPMPMRPNLHLECLLLLPVPQLHRLLPPVDGLRLQQQLLATNHPLPLPHLLLPPPPRPSSEFGGCGYDSLLPS